MQKIIHNEEEFVVLGQIREKETLNSFDDNFKQE
jgi:hypothetical protein